MKMKTTINELKSISAYDIAQNTQRRAREQQKTLYNTIRHDTRNKSKDNALNFYESVKKIYNV